MASPRLRALINRLARLTLVRPLSRFFIGLLLPPPPLVYESSLPPTSRGKGIEVIACGFPRSGTFSLKLALDRLGFACYHGVNAMQGKHTELWLKAATEETWNDWDQILQGYSAIADFPAACFYKRLISAYPNAKVILNVRDPEQWHRSCMETVFWWNKRLSFQVFYTDTQNKLVNAALWQGKFAGKFEEKEVAVNVYKSHAEEVKRVVPRENLLVYEAREGWAPLCEFLQVNVPETPFPSWNASSSFRKDITDEEKAFAVFTAVYMGFLAFALAFFLRRGFGMVLAE